MYLISGTLFAIFSMFLFAANDLFGRFTFEFNSPFLLIFALISLALGLFYTYLHFKKENK